MYFSLNLLICTKIQSGEAVQSYLELHYCCWFIKYVCICNRPPYSNHNCRCCVGHLPGMCMIFIYTHPYHSLVIISTAE